MTFFRLHLSVLLGSRVSVSVCCGAVQSPHSMRARGVALQRAARLISFAAGPTAPNVVRVWYKFFTRVGVGV